MRKTIICPKCSKKSPYSANYCSHCGRSFRQCKKEIERSPVKRLEVWELDPNFDYTTLVGKLYGSIYDKVSRDLLRDALEAIGYPFNQILIHYYGLSNKGRENYREIGDHLGITQQTARDKERRARRRLWYFFTNLGVESNG